MFNSRQLSDLGEQEFAYTSVPLPSPRHIRLLELFPTEFRSPSTGPSKCSIYSTSLDSSPHFQAVSYTWGSSVRTTAVRVRSDHGPEGIGNDSEFSVLGITSSLGEVIDRLRRPDGPVTLWIDQVCIN